MKPIKTIKQIRERDRKWNTFWMIYSVVFIIYNFWATLLCLHEGKGIIVPSIGLLASCFVAILSGYKLNQPPFLTTHSVKINPDTAWAVPVGDIIALEELQYRVTANVDGLITIEEYIPRPNPWSSFDS